MQLSSLSGNVKLVGAISGFSSLTPRVRLRQRSLVRGVTRLVISP
ncbi:hypothetical protein F383_30605 [Gossypium arboreum]|uniref:Uncharacterized protein n=1 Tax=Gossypium arboreum TaxID=29729 RepID=A0A0B0PG89_GOSAR|nr:hypothetical protein F383_30605 [Gossypium arboreum]